MRVAGVETLFVVVFGALSKKIGWLKITSVLANPFLKSFDAAAYIAALKAPQAAAL